MTAPGDRDLELTREIGEVRMTIHVSIDAIATGDASTTSPHPRRRADSP